MSITGDISLGGSANLDSRVGRTGKRVGTREKPLPMAGGVCLGLATPRTNPQIQITDFITQ